MTPEHNPPKDPSLAETKVLDRFPGWRPLQVGEVITYGDSLLWMGGLDLIDRGDCGETIDPPNFGKYFRPIAPAPQATEPQAPVLGDETAFAEKLDDYTDAIANYADSHPGSDMAYGSKVEKSKAMRAEILAQVSILKDAVTKAQAQINALGDLVRDAFDEGVGFGIEEAAHLSPMMTGGKNNDPTPIDHMWGKSDAAESLASLVSIIQPDGGKA